MALAVERLPAPHCCRMGSQTLHSLVPHRQSRQVTLDLQAACEPLTAPLAEPAVLHLRLALGLPSNPSVNQVAGGGISRC